MEILFTFNGEPITVSSPLHDHQEDQESDGLTTPVFLPDQDQEKAASGIQEKDLEKTRSLSLAITPSDNIDLSNFPQDPYNNNDPTTTIVIFNPNSKRKSLVSDEPQKKQKKIRRESSQPQPQPQAPRDLSTEFLRMIEPARPAFLYRKCLTVTDVDRGQNRLLVTETEKLMQFLTSDEERVISSEENSSIELKAVDFTGTEFKLRLSTWKGSRDQGEASTSNSTKERKPKKKKKPTIVFNWQWCDMLEANGVQSHDIVELWGFRRDGKFWLAANFFHH